MAAYDGDRATAYATALPAALRTAADGDVGPLVALVDEVLGRYGGRLFEGFHRTGSVPAAG